jgi:hypothetical protein
VRDHPDNEAPIRTEQERAAEDMLDTVKSKAGSAYLRAATATAVLVPLAALVGGIRAPNHNETLVRVRAIQ